MQWILKMRDEFKKNHFNRTLNEDFICLQEFRSTSRAAEAVLSGQASQQEPGHFRVFLMNCNITNTTLS